MSALDVDLAPNAAAVCCQEPHETLPAACFLASVVTKRASQAAFAKKHRAMTSPNVLDAIGDVFEAMMSE